MVTFPALPEENVLTAISPLLKIDRDPALMLSVPASPVLLLPA